MVGLEIALRFVAGRSQLLSGRRGGLQQFGLELRSLLRGQPHLVFEFERLEEAVHPVADRRVVLADDFGDAVAQADEHTRVRDRVERGSDADRQAGAGAGLELFDLAVDLVERRAQLQLGGELGGALGGGACQQTGRDHAVDAGGGTKPVAVFLHARIGVLALPGFEQFADLLEAAVLVRIDERVDLLRRRCRLPQQRVDPRERAVVEHLPERAVDLFYRSVRVRLRRAVDDLLVCLRGLLGHPERQDVRIPARMLHVARAGVAENGVVVAVGSVPGLVQR
ncbi:hypothetical protein [Glycomyces halotolerans]